MSKHPAEGLYVTLSLGEETFAVPVALVREILDYRDPFSLPDGPAWMLGLVDVRGRGTPLIDLRLKLGLAKTEPTPVTRILVLDVPLADRTLALGLVTDRVQEVANFPAASIENAPDVGIPWRSDYIAGVVHRENGFVVLLDVARLITTSDASLLSENLAA